MLSQEKHKYNGLISFDKSYNDWETIQEKTKVQTSSAEMALKGIIQCSPTSKLFFSDVNISALQLGIRNVILNKTCGKIVIGNQSLNELIIIMRSIYLQEFERRSDILSTVDQVKHINTKVIMYAVPRIIAEANMHNAYIKRITTLPVPLSHGVATSVAGTKTLEQKIF